MQTKTEIQKSLKVKGKNSKVKTEAAGIPVFNFTL
jgi:hypothetical protein